jgi:DNA-binding transcriptional regulator YiaG
MTVSREDYVYEESGLSHVVLQGIEVRRCAACKSVEPVILNIEGVHQGIARAVIEKPWRLKGEEVRFLRTYLGFRAVDFARVMGVSKECVSRWENDREPIGGLADRALRLLVQTTRPVSDYSSDALNALLESIQEEHKPIDVRLARRSGGWSEQENEVRARANDGPEAPEHLQDAAWRLFKGTARLHQRQRRLHHRRRQAAPSHRARGDLVRRASFPPPWDDLAEAAGGAQALANAFGITRLTLWRWSRGHTAPGWATQQFVNRWAAQRKIAQPWPKKETEQ